MRNTVFFISGAEIVLLAWVLFGYEVFKYGRIRWRLRREERMLRERGDILRNSCFKIDGRPGRP
jgi:hypothetical protein